jgi:RNA polymerase sigma-70 factor, ECF subfamily
MTEREQQDCFIKVTKSDEQAFEQLFKTYYGSLCHFAARILKDNETAEEVVQETMVKIWENRHTLKVNTSVRNYLVTAVRNRCLNQLQHDKVRMLHARKIIEAASPETDYSDGFLDPGLAEKIEASILSLPEKRREIFRLNREEGLKYREIADKLNLSLKTVEAQMGLALRTLRDKLKDFTSIILFLCVFQNTIKGK